MYKNIEIERINLIVQELYNKNFEIAQRFFKKLLKLRDMCFSMKGSNL